MFSGVKNAIRFLIALSVIAVLFFATSSLVLGLETNSPTANCLFGGHSMSICNMNPIEHIAEWQSVFTTTLQVQRIAFLAIFALSVFVAFSTRGSWNKFLIHNAPLLSSRLRSRLRDSFQTLDPLREAFSGGILHPKIF